MKEPPIIFSGPMVRAIIEGRKTQTRRIVKPGRDQEWLTADTLHRSPRARIVIINDEAFAFFAHPSSGKTVDGIKHDEWSPLGCVKCPYGKPGDRLWVRETWAAWDSDTDDRESDEVHGDSACLVERGITRHHLTYRADPRRTASRWRPSIHMPRWASRITLEIESVRVERLQEITEEDAKAEGVTLGEDRSWAHREAGIEYKPHVIAFSSLWQSINGPGSWDANPWVSVIQFKRVGAQ